MPISEQHLRSAGFVLHNGEPVGTCFVVSSKSERSDNESHAWLVTAAHVIQSSSKIVVSMRGIDGVGMWQVDNWLWPEDQTDITVAPFDPPGDQTFRYQAIPISDMAADTVPVSPKLGGDFHYVGLLSSVEQLTQDLMPVARRGSVAALTVPNVHWGSHDEWTASFVHLVDVRTFGGFSGSPCFIEAAYPVNEMPQGFPGPWKKVIEDARGVALEEYLMDTVFFTALWGMLVAHITSTGIGIVIPISVIREMLDSPEARDVSVGYREDVWRKG